MLRNCGMKNWIPGLVLVAALAGCSPDSQSPASALRTADISSLANVDNAPSYAETPFGNFLAGSFALRQRNASKAVEFLQRGLALDPRSGMLRDRLFLALLAAGRMNEALELAPSVPDTADTWHMTRLLLAIEALRLGDPDLAGIKVSEVPSGRLLGTIKHLILAWTDAARGEYETALASIELLRNPVLGRFLDLQSAFVMDLADRPDEARELYQPLAANGNDRATLALGRHYLRSGNRDKAKELYADFLSNVMELEVVERELERIEVETIPPPLVGNPAEGVAEMLYQFGGPGRLGFDRTFGLLLLRMAVHLRPDFDAAQLRIANYLRSMEQFEDALDAYRAIPGDSSYRRTIQREIAYVMEFMDRHDEAVDVLEKMAAAEPERYEALSDLADLYRRKSEFAKAVEVYDRVFELIEPVEKRHWRLLYLRGIALERLGRWERAEQDFQRSLEFNPDEPDVLNYLGYSWVDMGVNLDEALKLIEKAVREAPKNGYIVDSLGWAHYRLGNYPEAIRYLEEAVVLRPHDPIINDHLGDAYWQGGRRIEAGFQWKRALTLDPEPEAIDGIRAKLRDGLKVDPVVGKGEGPSE